MIKKVVIDGVDLFNGIDDLERFTVMYLQFHSKRKSRKGNHLEIIVRLLTFPPREVLSKSRKASCVEKQVE